MGHQVDYETPTMRVLPLLVLTLSGCWAQLAVPEDLECERGPHAAVWKQVKQRFRSLLEETPGALFNPIPEEKLKTVVDETIADVKAAGGFERTSTDECGYGKLALQLLSVCLVSDPMAVAQTVQSAGESFASPVLTLLLDIPWVATALSGWPLFGLLAQVSLRKAGVLEGIVDLESIDGVNKGSVYFTAMRKAMVASDLTAMADATVKYLDNPDVAGDGGALGALTALATQAAVQSNVQERLNLINGLQEAMKKAVHNSQDLDLMLATRWPLWSLIHFTVDAISVAPPPVKA